MIDPNKKYRTRDGREVRIYAVDGGKPYPVHGAVLHGSGDWCHENWTAEGDAYFDVARDDVDDLIEVKPRIKREVWVNVYRHEDGFEYFETFDGRLIADANSCDARIACIKLVIDCEEGEGL